MAKFQRSSNQHYSFIVNSQDIFENKLQGLTTRNLLYGIWAHLNPNRKAQVFSLLVLMIFSGVAELASLGAVLPFLTVLSDPQLIWEQNTFQFWAIQVGITDPSQLIIPLTALFVILVILASSIRLLNLWINGRLGAAIGSDLSCEAYKRTLYQPYEIHLQRNSSEVITSTINFSNGAVSAITAALQMSTAIIVVLFLMTALLLLSWQIACGTAIFFGGCYAALGSVTRKELRRNGKLVALASQKQIQTLNEGLGAIRDILLDGNQNSYIEYYQLTDRPQRRLRAKNQFLGSSPRFALEGMGLVLIGILGCFLVINEGEFNNVIPLLGAFALGSQRLLPSLQQVYSNWSALKAFNADMTGLLAMLNQPMPTVANQTKPLNLSKYISLKSVNFNYGSDQPKVINEIDLEIYRGETVGFIGTTGSGKSTLINIIMGLLRPTSGKIFIDSNNLYEKGFDWRVDAWRNNVAHVPQEIYLADASFAENIAFGIDPKQIDIERVEDAANKAQILDFVKSKPQGWDTCLGERGVRLSGGQRQRLGLARALYKNSNVLILDEATSALDAETEANVMESIINISDSLTVIIIAHRLNTVARCDRIIRLDKGRIAEQGPPNVLLK